MWSSNTTLWRGEIVPTRNQWGEVLGISTYKPALLCMHTKALCDHFLPTRLFPSSHALHGSDLTSKFHYDNDVKCHKEEETSYTFWGRRDLAMEKITLCMLCMYLARWQAHKILFSLLKFIFLCLINFGGGLGFKPPGIGCVPSHTFPQPVLC